MGEDNKFLVTLIIKKGNTDHGHVYYKQDGQRFDYSCTLKMNVETQYSFTISMRPPQTLESASVGETSVTIEADDSNHGSRTYNMDWFTTGHQVTKRNIRSSIPITLNVRGLGLLTLTLQVKFYKQDDSSHSTWGNALHHIEYECESSKDKLAVHVTKESYR